MSDITKADKVYVSTSKNGDYVSAVDDGDSVAFIRADLVPQWQPIETAPKDGTCVMTYTDGLDPIFEQLPMYYDVDKGWYCCMGYDLQPTHWQPLPTPPPAT